MIVNPFSYLIEKLKGKVDKSGDTMSGNLNLEKANGEISVKCQNTTKLTSAYIYSANSGEHGIWSNGYHDGSFHNSGLWLVNRGTDGSVKVNGTSVPSNGGTVALTSDITTHSINTEVAWGSSTSISRSGTNSMLITGGRQGYGFQVFVPKDTNEYVILSNVNGCLDSVSVVGDTITLTVRSSGYGSKCQIFVSWN